MNWKFWKKETEPKDKTEPEKIDGWRLTIRQNGGQDYHYYENPSFKNLSKMYFWYLTRDSEKYNMKFIDGMRIYNRSSIEEMQMTKVKLDLKNWTKENNDET